MHRKHDLNNERQNKEILSQRNKHLKSIWGVGGGIAPKSYTVSHAQRPLSRVSTCCFHYCQGIRKQEIVLIVGNAQKTLFKQ
jgi:hypothetical protein